MNHPVTAHNLVLCGVGDQTFGVDMTWVRAIQRADQLQRATGADGLIGHVRERDSQIPVFSLAARLGLPCEAARSMQQILMMDAPRPWGLLVDRVSQVLRTSTSDLRP